MTTTFITGDRSDSLIYPGLVAVEMLRVLGRGQTISTGSNPTGVDALVRHLADAAGVEVILVPLPVTTTDEGKPNWDEVARDVLELPYLSEVVAIHTDPHASSIIRALMNAMDATDDLLRLVTPAELLA